jgi:AraC-like DNA-binding protein
LSTTSASLAEIAYKAGFYDQGHLSRGLQTPYRHDADSISSVKPLALIPYKRVMLVQYRGSGVW